MGCPPTQTLNVCTCVGRCCSFQHSSTWPCQEFSSYHSFRHLSTVTKGSVCGCISFMRDLYGNTSAELEGTSRSRKQCTSCACQLCQCAFITIHESQSIASSHDLGYGRSTLSKGSRGQGWAAAAGCNYRLGTRHSSKAAASHEEGPCQAFIVTISAL